MIEVLEHTPTAYNTAGEIHRVLRPGGVWMVSVPNPYHVKEIIWNLLRVPDRQGHIYSWTRQTITRLGEMNGFRLPDLGGTHFYPPIPPPEAPRQSGPFHVAKTFSAPAAPRAAQTP